MWSAENFDILVIGTSMTTSAAADVGGLTAR
jgi:hypothetical protein